MSVARRPERPLRSAVKRVLAEVGRLGSYEARGITILTYHRVGGGTADELDVAVEAFEAQLDLLAAEHDVLTLDAALDRLSARDERPGVVLTFDDGFADVYDVAFPRLLARALPFTLYLAAGLVGRSMAWEGSSAASQGSPAVSWPQVREMYAAGSCTVGNHTFTHSGPRSVDATELARCSEMIEQELGRAPHHFAWTWGIPVPALIPEVRSRFRSTATGSIGRNFTATDRHALRRVPIRRSDPISFFEAKLHGDLWPERTYDRLVRVAKRAREPRSNV